ncbi:WD40 repeat domain-containing protein [Deinococcus ficus]|uniref:WD40 repeat domain-containing protein n=1 Tax=Deinococcus ficus TaxID=317577 RepID=UPI0003B4F646|nr:WD40 repeat domain-containing protein [Deinococcus ficus]
MTLRRTLSKPWFVILGACVLAAVLAWLRFEPVLTRILYTGERYPGAGSMTGSLKYEGFDVAAPSSTGQALAAGSVIAQSRNDFSATVSVIERPGGTRRWRTALNTPENFRSVNAVLWSPDDQQVVSNDTDGDVTVLDARSGHVLQRRNVHTYRPCVFQFVPGGLLQSERDTRNGQTFLTLRSWPALTPVWRIPIDCWDAATGNVDASGTLAVVALGDGRRVGVVDLQTRAFRGAIIELPTDAPQLYSLSLRPDGRQVAGGLRDGTVMVWDLPSGRVRWQFHAHGDLVRALSWDASGDALASSAFGGCGWLKSECVVVTRFSSDAPQSRVVWHHRNNAAQAAVWLKRSTLLLTESQAVFTVKTGLSEP